MTGSVLLFQALGDAVRAAVPQWLVPVFLGITRLGNVGVFLVVFTLDYWFVDRERGAHAIAIVVGGMALITALKYFFAVPRPPAEVNVVPIDGFSFPSGHATGATIAYGTLAIEHDAFSDLVRYGAVAALIGLIALSRVVLGVHFVRDVLAGIVFGVGFLLVAFGITRRDPRSGFLLAVAVAGVALVVSDFSRDGVILFGSAVGAATVWELAGSGSTVDRTSLRVALVAVVLPILAVLGYVVIKIVPPPIVIFVLTVVLGAGLIGAPAAVAELDDRDAAEPA
ncbi:phosphatase PAP2 family protein [Halosimplex aquaticum]|uniref:Phosphatase PAP2 family protein n=1 Tax=Halosimplex aquaticum TaxID=3026162 RepID=A0ABD5Y7U2_9EURY|nr:phosphatase PAP2 family protein [Halosimplex aquaticum]